MRPAYISGAGMTTFGRHGDTPLYELGVTAARAALDDAGSSYNEIGEVVTSSSMAPPQEALLVAHTLGRTGVPVTAMESASAGGLVALRHAVEAVRSGRCDAALAIGYEKTTALEPGGVVPAARTIWDRCPPQVHYAIEAARLLHDRACGPEVFAAIAAKDWNSAARNPRAARHPDHEVTIAEVLAARPVASPLTRMMCHAAADGGAAIVVTATPGPRAIEVRSIVQTSLFVDPTWPDSGPVVGPPSQTTRTARQAFAAADAAAGDVDVVSLHDMCASEELTTLVALGLCTADEAVEMAMADEFGIGGRLPTNVDGGCIARGHPFGATGLAQAAEIVQQVRGEAGERQVAQAATGLVQAAGGGGSCVVAVLSAG